MKVSRYSDSQILSILKQAESGAPVPALCREYGMIGLCFLYLRNIKDLTWNHKHVYRIDRQLELNLRIKTRRRLKRD